MAFVVCEPCHDCSTLTAWSFVLAIAFIMMITNYTSIRMSALIVRRVFQSAQLKRSFTIPAFPTSSGDISSSSTRSEFIC